MKKRSKILRMDKNLFIIEKKLDSIKHRVEVVTAEDDNEKTLIKEAEDAEIIITCYDRIPASVINSAKKLKGIVKYGVGTDNIDIEAATNKGVLVVNCPDYGSDTVADHAFALMICLARKIIEIDRAMKNKAWEWPSPKYLGLDLSRKTIGIIGFGRIGRAMARRAQGFGMKIIAYDPYVKEEEIKSLDVKLVGIDELLKTSDFISIHCVLTPETKGMVNEEMFKKMKKTVLFVNVSRGAIADQNALMKALKEKWIAGAGFDVFEKEPLTSDYPLLNMNNVILTPHLAWYTREAFERCEEDTFRSVLEILDGGIPKNLKNRDVLKHVKFK